MYNDYCVCRCILLAIRFSESCDLGCYFKSSCDVNTKKKMADTSSDLLWDHSAEDLDGNPLLNTYHVDTPTRQRRGLHDAGVGISKQILHYNTEQLIENLDESRELLLQYLEDLNYNDTQKQDPSLRQQNLFNRLCGRCSRLVEKATGTNSVIFTVILQALNLIIQTVIDIWSKKDDENVLIVSCLTMIVLQLLNLIFILITSVKLGRQLYNHHVNGMFLIQTYIASILLFAGLYTVTSRMKISSWKDIHEDVLQNPGLIVVLYAKFLYFSVSTATLCGTSSTTPNEWYNFLLVSLQMLISFMYFTSILGHALTPLPKNTRKISRRPAISEQELRTEENSPIIRSFRRSVSHDGDSPVVHSSNAVTGYGSIQ